MTTAQILLIGLTILLLVITISATFGTKREEIKAPLFMISMMLLLILSAIAISVTIRMNILSSKNPCPQLERVENVYKLK